MFVGPLDHHSLPFSLSLHSYIIYGLEFEFAAHLRVSKFRLDVRIDSRIPGYTLPPAG